MNHTPIVVERTYSSGIASVWKALTDKNEMKKWYFNLAEFIPEKGFRFSFTGGPSEDRQYVHLCEITEVVEGQKIAYTWRYEGYEGCSEVCFLLLDQQETTHLVLTHTGIHTFPDDNPDLAIENFREGWNQIININLTQYLDNLTPERI